MLGLRMLNAMTRTANEVDAKIKKLNEELTSQGKEEISTRWWFDNAATPEDIDVLVQMGGLQKSTKRTCAICERRGIGALLTGEREFRGRQREGHG